MEEMEGNVIHDVEASGWRLLQQDVVFALRVV